MHLFGEDWNSVLHLLRQTPVDTGRKMKVDKTFRRCPGRPLNVICTFDLRPLSRVIAGFVVNVLKFS